MYNTNQEHCSRSPSTCCSPSRLYQSSWLPTKLSCWCWYFTTKTNSPTQVNSPGSRYRVAQVEQAIWKLRLELMYPIYFNTNDAIAPWPTISPTSYAYALGCVWTRLTTALLTELAVDCHKLLKMVDESNDEGRGCPTRRAGIIDSLLRAATSPMPSHHGNVAAHVCMCVTAQALW